MASFLKKNIYLGPFLIDFFPEKRVQSLVEPRVEYFCLFIFLPLRQINRENLVVSTLPFQASNQVHEFAGLTMTDKVLSEFVLIIFSTRY